MKATHAATVARSDDDQPFMSEENSYMGMAAVSILEVL
jgi:hypothetical protein